MYTQNIKKCQMPIIATKNKTAAKT